MTGTPISGQEHFRFRSDTDTVDSSSAVWLAAEDTNITMVATTVPFRLRFGIQNTGTASVSLQRLIWSKNGGSYTTYSTVSTGVIAHSSASASPDVTAVTTANFRLTAMSGNKQAGVYDSNSAVSVSLSSLSNTEMEFGLALVAADFVNGDTLDFRVTTNSTTPSLTSYDVTPRITIGTGTTNNIMGQIVL